MSQVTQLCQVTCECNTMLKVPNVGVMLFDGFKATGLKDKKQSGYQLLMGEFDK